MIDDSIFDPPTQPPFQPQPLPAVEKPEKQKRRRKKKVAKVQKMRITRKAIPRASVPIPNVDPTPALLAMQGKKLTNLPIARAVLVGSIVPAKQIDALVALIEAYEKAPPDVKEAFRRLFG